MPDHESEGFSPQTRRYLAVVMLDVVEVFLRLRKRLPASHIETFLTVATNEGLTVSELAVKCSVGGAVMSRHLGELGARNRKGGAGLGLLAMVQQTHGDRRERQVVLTEKGVAVARQAVAAARGEGPRAQKLLRRTSKGSSRSPAKTGD